MWVLRAVQRCMHNAGRMLPLLVDVRNNIRGSLMCMAMCHGRGT